MSKLTAFLATFFLLACAGAAYSQSLADLAKKEKERRQQIKSESKVITNRDAARFSAGSSSTATRAAEAAPQKPGSEKEGATDASAKETKPASDEPTDFQGRPESYWRQTLADARKKIKELENEANVITLKIADLQNQFYREADGFRQQTIQRDVNKSFYEQDLNKEKLAAAKAELDDLMKEARKSGALPGWLDDRPPRP
jgi:poly-D-alanine transfer protein DltD